MLLPALNVYCENRVADPVCGFSVIAMTTNSAAYLSAADRLLDSCARAGLDARIFLVPSVHRSISPKGTDDMRYSKPAVIRAAIELLGRPVLYLDSDCIVRKPLGYLDELLAGNVDFAAYNWLADPQNCAYTALPVRAPGGDGELVLHNDRFYKATHLTNRYTRQQLYVSGCTQLYNCSAPAQRLLTAWYAAIQRFPGATDDSCLDFAFNNRLYGEEPLIVAWLGKQYARYPHWFYVEPVIEHPDVPCGRDTPGMEYPMDGDRKRVYLDRGEEIFVPLPFPEEYYVDVVESRLCVDEGGGVMRPVAQFRVPIWPPSEAL